MVAGRLLIGLPADQLLFSLLISDLWEFNLSFQYRGDRGDTIRYPVASKEVKKFKCLVIFDLLHMLKSQISLMYSIF